jgi:formylglycine-generating enzyme required for sulfatase activity
MKPTLAWLVLVISATALINTPAIAQIRLMPGQTVRDCARCSELVVLPAGEFLIGSPETEPERDPSEGPQRRVSIKPFAIAKFDVTRGQWREFVDATKRPISFGCEWAGFPRDQSARASWRDLGFAQTDDHPVVCVSWNDAQAYVAWLSKRTGKRYRLPTEAEWEYAARAGSTTTYPWGDAASHDRANYGANECCSELASGKDRWLYTSPVGSFPPNAFGLYDMLGDAWQWVEDCYSDSYVGAPTDGSAVQKPTCQLRVLRGGTWGDTPGLIRPAYRNWAPPPRWPTDWEYRSGGVGFRVARDLEN